MILRLFVSLLVLSTLVSCNYVFKSKKSQSFYHDKTEKYIVGNHSVVSINPQKLKEIIQNTNYKYYYILHCNMYCKPVWNKFKLSCRLFNNKEYDSVYLIPVIHDYLNDVRPMIYDTSNYNIHNKIFITDANFYGKCLNSNKSYTRDFIGKFSNYDSMPIGKDVSFAFKDKIVLIQVDFPLGQNTTLSEIHSSSYKINFSF